MAWLKNKWFLFYLFAFLLVGVFLLVVIVFQGKGKPSPGQPILPTPTKFAPKPTSQVLPPVPGQSEEYKKSAEEIYLTQAPQIKKDALVGQLLSKLPYHNDFFTLSYDYSTNKFFLILDQAHSDEANKKFDEFLKENGILDRSWIRNLEVKYR